MQTARGEREKTRVLNRGKGVVVAVRSITVKVRSIYAVKFFKVSAESWRGAGGVLVYS